MLTQDDHLHRHPVMYSPLPDSHTDWTTVLLSTATEGVVLPTHMVYGMLVHHDCVDIISNTCSQLVTNCIGKWASCKGPTSLVTSPYGSYYTESP